ncbi:MAG: class I SAM-dependent methyltransferase [Candidatus Wallbacteria bacterium]|nr:class I SAM-dependent methyltransferase [Candidatus Wallbacteria bacterium]
MNAAKKQMAREEQPTEKVSLARKLKKLGSTLALKADILRTNKNKGSTEHVNKLYNLFAPFYDLVWPSMKDYMSSCRYLVDKSVHDGEYVLDVGTGTGVLSLLVAERGNHVIGFDLHPKMLARTRKKAEKQGKKNANMRRLTLCRGDATILPFGERKFDVVTSGFMLVHLSHEQKISAVAEMRRVLTDRGQIALLESRGELTKRYDTREEWEQILRTLGFGRPVIEDIYDVYRVIFATKQA